MISHPYDMHKQHCTLFCEYDENVENKNQTYSIFFGTQV